MPDDFQNLPPHVQAQIAAQGEVLANNDAQVANVAPESGPPTDWTNHTGQQMVPEPQQVEPIQPEAQAPEAPAPEH